MSKISIVTPFYNVSRKFKHCFQSVINQSMADFEWIIVDDCSHINELTKLLKIIEKDKRIKLITNLQNNGAAKSRYIAIQHCTAPYTTFIDADDMLVSGALQAIVQNIEMSNADILVTNSFLHIPYINKDIPYFEAAKFDIWKEDLCSGYEACKAMLLNNGITSNVWDKTIKTELLRKYYECKWDISIAEDFHMLLDILPNASAIKSLNVFAYKWCYSGMSHKYYLNKWDEYKKTITLILKDRKYSKWHPMIKENYIYQLRESVVQRILSLHSKKRIECFIQEALQHEAIKFLDETPENILEDAKRHLRIHKKYYIFTRVLNLFL